MIHDNLLALTARAPLTSGLRQGDTFTPYAALLERIARTAAGLADRGVARGDVQRLLAALLDEMHGGGGAVLTVFQARLGPALLQLGQGDGVLRRRGGVHQLQRLARELAGVLGIAVRTGRDHFDQVDQAARRQLALRLHQLQAAFERGG